MNLTQLYAIMLAALRALGLVPRAPEPPPEDPPPPPETAGSDGSGGVSPAMADLAAQARDSDWVDDCLDLPRPGIGLGSAHPPPPLGPSPPIRS